MNALVQTRDTAFDAAAYAIQADLMDQIKFQWYAEMYGEGFGYENHIRWNDPIDLTNSGAILHIMVKVSVKLLHQVMMIGSGRFLRKKLMRIQILLKQIKTSI